MNAQEIIKELRKRDSAIRGKTIDYQDEAEEAKKKFQMWEEARQESERLKDLLIKKQE